MNSRPGSLFRLLHKHLWRRLPAGPRRRLLQSLTSFLAPTISANARARPPVIVVGLFRQASGLGAAARACHDALRASGIPTYGIDLTVALKHEVNYTDFAYVDGRQIKGPATLLCHIGGPTLPLALCLLGRRFVTGKHVIAHWFWELPSLPSEWHAAASNVHQICVNTRFVADAVEPQAQGRPVHVVTYPLPTPARPSSAHRTTNVPFTVLVIFNVASNFARKNPLAAITAFRRAFGNDPSARLIVKYSNVSHWPPAAEMLRKAIEGTSNIELIGDIADRTGMEGLYDRADVVLSLHRAEGLGLVIAEAMLRGIAVVATDWSGSTDFLNRETGAPVDYRLIPIDDPQGQYIVEAGYWADPDIDAASRALQWLRDDPQQRRALAEAGCARARHVFAVERYARQIQELLAQ